MQPRSQPGVWAAAEHVRHDVDPRNQIVAVATFWVNAHSHPRARSDRPAQPYEEAALISAAQFYKLRRGFHSGLMVCWAVRR